MSLDIYLEIQVDTGGLEPYRVALFSANATHNLTWLWDAIGVYDALYMKDGN